MKHKTHKLLSILLCTVMMLGILPTMAFAETTDKVTIEGVVLPVVGITNVTSGIQCESYDGTVGMVDGYDYYWSARKNSTDEWSKVYDDGSSTETVDNSLFREGYQYRLSLKVTATNDSDTYTGNTKVVLLESGVYASDTTFDDQSQSITAHFIFDGAKENGAFSFDISKTVEQGGSATPGARTFTFELVDEDGQVPADYGITMDELKVTTNGVGTFTETITGNASRLSGNTFSTKKFTISEKNDGASGWTYSDQSYVVEISYNPTTGLAFAEVYYGNDAVAQTARFTNTYVRNTVTIIEDNEKPEETNPSTGAMVDAPQTNDNSNMILWIALLLISAFGVTGAVVYSKRKKYTE